MIQRREIVMLIVLSIITCGIYTYYFMYTATRDLNQMAGNDGKGTEPSTVILLSIVTCGIYAYYWYYTQGNRMQNLANGRGFKVDENGTTYLMWGIFGALLCGIGYYVMIHLFVKNLNVLADDYNAYMASQGNGPV
ncbi:MAG: DUF4234 domain-containing protein [Bacillota bacterium]